MKFTTTIFVFSLSLRLFAVPAAEDDRMRIIFSPETGGIESIVNKVTGHDFVSAPSEKPKLWHLVLKTTKGIQAQLHNYDCEKPAITLTGNTAELAWTNLAVSGANGRINVRVKCSIQESDHLAHFRIDVDNNSDASILSAVFPEIKNLGTAGKSDVAFPKSNWGQMFNALRKTVVGRYPSADMPMQFFSLSETTNSIYVAAHDPGAMFKTFRIKPGDVYSVETSVPDATVPGNDWHEPFDFVLGVYEGDWVISCKMYRKWALAAAPWTKRGPISKRKDTASAVKEVGVWLNVDEKFAQNEKSALEFRKAMGVPIGVQWYFWHNNIMDRDLPDYLPPKPGFVETIGRLNEAEGIYSMPYINGRCWDTQNKKFDTARPFTSFDQAGAPNLEDYGSGTKLAVMCLGTPFWQNYLTGMIERVVNTTGVGGIYIDQLAGADIEECYNPQHGHTLGRDTWWITGYCKSVTAVRDYYAKKPGGFFVAAENDAEPYMNFVDLFLIWIPRSEDDIPMMTLVYSGYAQYFGSNRGSDTDMSFAMMQARDFTWGAQLYWESPAILNPGQEEKLKILRNLAQLRYQARKYFVGGELITVVKPTNVIPLVTGKWGGWSLKLEDRTLPSVHAALWKAGDGSYAVVLANADVKEHSFEFEIPPALASRKRWNVEKITPGGAEDLGMVGNKGRLTTDVPSRDGLILQFN